MACVTCKHWTPETGCTLVTPCKAARKQWRDIRRAFEKRKEKRKEAQQ